MADAHSISFERDEAGVKAVSCSCGWQFRGWRIPLVPGEIAAYYKRATSIEFDTAVADHERQHANGWH